MFSPCRFCDGNCCASFVITVTSFDVKRIASATGMKPKEFAELRRLDLLSFDENQVIECKNGRYVESCLLALKSHPCHFFDGKKGCMIHEHKPLACRIYPFSENKGFGKRTLCPMPSNLLFRFFKPDDSLFLQYKVEKSAYQKFVGACNKRKLAKEDAFVFLTQKTPEGF